MANLGKIVVLVCALASAGFGVQNRVSLEGIHAITTNDQVSEWITYYYEHPRPDLAKSALLFCATEGYFASQKVETPSVYFVFEEVLRANPSLKNDYLAVGLEGAGDVKRVIAFAIWVSGLATAADLDSLSNKDTKSYLAELKKQAPPDLLTTQQISPTLLDAFWAAFFVTGDERYVERVAAYVPWIEQGKDPVKLLIGGAARWSLTSNAIQHQKVMAAVKRLARQASGQKKELLDQVVKDAEKELTS